MTSIPTLEMLLAEAAPRLTERVVGEMYADAFWQARFGDRGRRHAGQDGGSHVQYVVEALVAADQRVFTEYASWLRGVLVPRGMCSRHLAENFDRLASAISQEPWPDRDRAVAMLRAGTEALVHTSGDAGAIDAVRSSLASETAALLYTLHPDWLERSGDPARTRCVDDLDYHLSYLADALACAERERFVAHIVFVAGFLGRSGVPVGHLRESLVALTTVIRSRFPATTGTPFQFLEAAGDALDPERCGHA